MRLHIVSAVLASLVLTACATTGGPAASPTGKPVAAAVVKAKPGLTPAERQKAAIDHLYHGQPEQARAELRALILEQPANTVARGLLEQVDQDPHALLGDKSYAYKVRPGETMSVLAQRFLGDPMMFYALARYNGMSTPTEIVAGQTLQIPGAPRKVMATAPRPVTMLPPSATSAAAPPPAAPPAVSTRNPTRAAQLRGQGLENLNRGAVDKAVALFRQALSFDPGNPVIQKDLDRAVRIQKTVSASR